MNSKRSVLKCLMAAALATISAAAAQAQGLQAAVARSKQSGLPMFVMASSDS